MVLRCCAACAVEQLRKHSEWSWRLCWVWCVEHCALAREPWMGLGWPGEPLLALDYACRVGWCLERCESLSRDLRAALGRDLRAALGRDADATLRGY